MTEPLKRPQPLLALSLRQLLYFVTLARTRSFTETAAELSITQPALSTAVKQMEALLDAPLFDRATHPIAITELGREILPMAEHLLDTARSTFGGMKDSARLQQRTVRISMLPSAVGRVVPVLGHLVEQRPDIRLEIRDVINPGPTEEVLTGTSDIGVGVTSGDDRLLEVPVFDDPLAVVMTPDDALASQETVSWAALNGRDIAAFQYGDMVNWLGRVDGRQELPRIVPRYKTEYLTSLCAMVSARLAITVLPMMYTDLLHARELVARRLESPLISRSIVVIRRRNLSRSEAVDTCFNLLRGALAAYATRDSRLGGRRRKSK